MSDKEEQQHDAGVTFVYDGDCPICAAGASLYKVKETAGALHTVNAREEKDHPLMLRINDAGLDLDKGMVIAYQGRLYQGAEALHIMAELGADANPAAFINNRLFRSKTACRIGYPPLRAARRFALMLKGKGLIRNLEK